MVFIPATCPNCGGSLQVPDDRERVKCMYCGVDMVLKEQDQVQKKTIDNYLALARIAEQSENHQEAYKYFSLVLETDPKHIEAWVGKGTAAGWQSTVESPRVQETTTCLEKAIELGLDDNQLRSRAADAAHNIAYTFFDAARKHREFPQHSTQYETGLSDVATRMYKDNLNNWQMEKEFVDRAMASVSLIRVAWLLRPNSATARHTITM